MVDFKHLFYRYAEVATFGVLVLLFEFFILVLYSVWSGTTHSDAEADASMRMYPFMRDIFIMIFFGFGFLMAYLRRYGYSAICYSILIAALSCQISVIFQFFFTEFDKYDSSFNAFRNVTIYELVNALFCAGAVLISYGAILGKTTPSQLVVLCFFEPFFFWVNEFVILDKLEVFDAGGGFTIHIFGCYFGLALTVFLTNKNTKGHQDNTSCYSSDLFSLAGSLFLFMMWPSFNCVLYTGAGQLNAVVNTFLSLTGAVVGTFLTSRWLVEGMYDICHLQNSTLAGGVVMGIAAHLPMSPATAIACGFMASIVSVCGYKYLTPLLGQWLRIQDVCGVHNLHGMPGIMGALLSIFLAAGLARTDDSVDFDHNNQQAGYQTAALFITLGIAIGSGLFTGFIMWLMSFLRPIPASDYFNDRTFWELPSDYEWVVESEKDAKGHRKVTYLRTTGEGSKIEGHDHGHDTPEGAQRLKKKKFTRTGSKLDLTEDESSDSEKDSGL